MGWPSCRYSRDGEARIFQSEEDVPPGWADHPRGPFPDLAVRKRGRPKKAG